MYFIPLVWVLYGMLSVITFLCENNTFILAVRGILDSVDVSLSDRSFAQDPPVFSLKGRSIGGSPTSYIWRRNGELLPANSSFRVVMNVDSSNSSAFIKSIYVCTLTVVGRFPGTYSYSVSNRAKPSYTLKDHIDITGIYI